MVFRGKIRQIRSFQARFEYNERLFFLSKFISVVLNGFLVIREQHLFFLQERDDGVREFFRGSKCEKISIS